MKLSSDSFMSFCRHSILDPAVSPRAYLYPLSTSM
jgi:hypothetical protein